MLVVVVVVVVAAAAAAVAAVAVVVVQRLEFISINNLRNNFNSCHLVLVICLCLNGLFSSSLTQ